MIGANRRSQDAASWWPGNAVPNGKFSSKKMLTSIALYTLIEIAKAAKSPPGTRLLPLSPYKTHDKSFCSGTAYLQFRVFGNSYQKQV